LSEARDTLSRSESERDALQSQIQSTHQRHADVLGSLQASRARAEEYNLRGERLQQDTSELARERSAAEAERERAIAELSEATAACAGLASTGMTLAQERDARRAHLSEARARAQSAQLAARELHVQVESRRSTESSVAVGVGRMSEQRAQLEGRRAELDRELARGDEPILSAQARLNEALALRLGVEGELAVARGALEEAEIALRALDEQRLAAEQRVNAAREAMEQARLSAQETHVRRAALAEQFAATGCNLAEVLAGLNAEANGADWEQRLADARADIERLGSVNLAAIDELKDHTQRKEYLDSQFADLTSALDTRGEGTHGRRAGVLDLRPQSGAFLPAGRGRCAAR